MNFYRLKNIQVDLVILDEEENNYERYVKEEIINSILNKNLSYMQNINGGIFIIEDKEAKDLLEFKANIIIDASKGEVSRQIKDLEEEYLEKIFAIFDDITSDAYYVQMAVAWAISICLIRFYNETIKYLRIAKLDKFTYNKALQKAIESYRITKEQKDELKNMKMRQ